MSAMMTAGILGLTLGLRHAFEPDHLAAVGTFVPRNTSPRRAAVLGALWGGGHAAGLLLLGSVAIAMRLAIPGWVDAALECVVGVMLVALGTRAVLSVRRTLSRGPGLDDVTPTKAATSSWGPVGVGIAHGFAGTGAAVLLASATMKGAVPAMAFLGLFGLGATIGMATIAGVLGIPMQAARTLRLRQGALVVLGFASILVGAWWLVRAVLALA